MCLIILLCLIMQFSFAKTQVLYKLDDSSNMSEFLRERFIKKGHFQFNSLQGFAYYRIKDSLNNSQWFATDIGTSLFFEYTFRDRLNIGLGMSFHYDKYNYTFNRSSFNQQVYFKYFPPFGQKSDKYKFLKNTFFVALGFGRGNEYPTPIRGKISAQNKSIYMGLGLSIVPKRLFHNYNKHWGFDFMWYTPNIVLFKNYQTANPGGVGVKYIW